MEPIQLDTNTICSTYIAKPCLNLEPMSTLFIFFLTAVAERTKKRKAFANADKEKRERVKLLDFRKVQTSSFSESAFCEKMHVWVSRIFTFFMSYSWRWGEGEKKIKETFLLRHYSAIFWERHSKTKNLRLWSFNYIFKNRTLLQVLYSRVRIKKKLANFYQY